MIASAAGVVIAAFLALLLSTLSVLRSMGPALAIAVAVTLLAGLTLIPAVVSLLGPRVFWPSRSWRREPQAARFTALGRALEHRPGAFAAVSGLVLVALAIGAFGYKPTFDLSSAGIPASAGSQTALHTLEKGLPPGATDPTDVLLHATAGRPLPRCGPCRLRRQAEGPARRRLGSATQAERGPGDRRLYGDAVG